MLKKTFTAQGKVWLYPGKAAWHFFSVSPEVSEKIDFYFSHAKRGWGSLPVVVTVGETQWKTSIFPDKKTKTYLLPLKSEVRKKEGMSVGQKITVSLEISE